MKHWDQTAGGDPQLKQLAGGLVSGWTALCFSMIGVMLLISGASGALTQRWERSLNAHVSYLRVKHVDAQGRQNIGVLTVNLNHPDVLVRPALADGYVRHRRTVSDIARQNQACAAINGSFFDPSTGLPVGLIIIDGRMVSMMKLRRTTLGLTRSGQAIMGIPDVSPQLVVPRAGIRLPVWGVNRPRKADEVILFTPEYGWRTRTNPHGVDVLIKSGQGYVQVWEGNAAIPPDGYVVSLHGQSKKWAPYLLPGREITLESGLSPGWDEVAQAVTGGPRLVQGGRVAVNRAEENFRGGTIGRQPRSAVGITPDNRLLLVAVDGRNPAVGRGMTFTELAQLLVSLGARDAMGLDSGGSSTLYADGKVLNHPSDGRQRRVSNALIVKLRR